MAPLSAIPLTLCFLAFPFGQLLRINFQHLSFPLFDLLVFLLFLVNLFFAFKNHQLQTRRPILIAFLIYTLISLIINLVYYQITSPKPLLYFARLSVYLSFFIIPLQKQAYPPQIKPLFHLCLIVVIVFGFIQYFFWPDLTLLDSLNWDPHLFRLTSSFLDPAFTGLILLLFLTELFLKPDKKLTKLLLIPTYLSLSLTYSRATFLSLLLTSAFISRQLKKPKIFFFSLFLILATFLVLPRLPGEGTKLERTSSIKAKIENYQEGIQVFLRRPLIGHGYNTLYFVRRISQPQSHANFGFDSSLLTILATTGILGFLLFSSALKKIFLSRSLAWQSLFLATLFHSFFSNSLLYPWVLFYLALKYRN